MNLSRPFILRPIATSLLMAGLLLVGALAFKQLPVSALPQVDYPTIQVQTFYPGGQRLLVPTSIDDRIRGYLYEDTKGRVVCYWHIYEG